MKTLFPPYLEKGSTGPAVCTLQELLYSHGYAVEGLEVDGDYGDLTVESVKVLQKDVAADVDGKFGPGTRAAFKAQRGVDVDVIPAGKDYLPTHWYGEGASEEGSEWPEDDDDADPEDDTLDGDNPGDPDGD